MEQNDFVFLPSAEGMYQLPLGRYIPSLPQGIIRSWLSKKSSPGSVILDPIGSNPYVGIEAAQCGYRVLVARNNPVLWLMMEVLAATPDEHDFRTTINKLLISRRGTETLEDHLRSIYQTVCLACGQQLQPQGYIWEKGAAAPTAKVYTCPKCGDQGERSITETDLHNLQRLGSFQLHRNRAFHRVLQGGEYEQESIESALDCYLPRALYVIMTLINAMERLPLDKGEKRLLQATFLTVFDEGNSLWHWPPRDHRPLTLGSPSTFLEKNLWLALETSPLNWEHPGPSTSVSYWPNMPPQSGGICLYNRRVASQPTFDSGAKPDTLLALFPRPNQAFWTFSALWAGWLWGRKAVNPMRSALARRHYDWHWFAHAIHTTLIPFKESLEAGIPLFGILAHASPNHHLSALTGCHTAGFRLQGASYRQEADLVQSEYTLMKETVVTQQSTLQDIVLDYLNMRGEPANFVKILIHCLNQLALSNQIPENMEAIHEGLFRKIQEDVAAVLNDEHFAVSHASNLKGGSRWWLLDDRNSQPPLSEQVETFIRQRFIADHSLSAQQIEAEVCEKFQGSQTPESSLIHTCVLAYTQIDAQASDIYEIRSEDLPDARESDLLDLKNILHIAGEKLAFRVNTVNGAILWIDSKNQVRFRYFFSVQCPSIQILQSVETSASTYNVMVFPASRSRLLLARMRRDPRLEAFQNRNWHLLKFRHLRWLAAREELTHNMWEELLDGDPPLWDAPDQIQMI